MCIRSNNDDYDVVNVSRITLIYRLWRSDIGVMNNTDLRWIHKLEENRGIIHIQYRLSPERPLHVRVYLCVSIYRMFASRPPCVRRACRKVPACNFSRWANSMSGVVLYMPRDEKVLCTSINGPPFSSNHDVGADWGTRVYWASTTVDVFQRKRCTCISELRTHLHITWQRGKSRH